MKQAERDFAAHALGESPQKGRFSSTYEDVDYTNNIGGLF